jgi:AraC-like DNA-binding protein
VVRFALPREELRPYVTTYYFTEIRCSEREPAFEDYLHPEWPNLRFIRSVRCESAIGPEPMRSVPAFAARLVKGQAGDYADRFVDGLADPAFAAFHPLARALDDAEAGFEGGLAVIEEHMDRILASGGRARAEESGTIRAINAALVETELATVADLAQRVGMTVRSLERLTRRAFGFTPKLLLRRQRFLRSLSQFMLDPSLKWLEALDCQYHDQAHFVRDFKRFMGMNPSDYAKLDKPFLVAAARARMEIAGQAVQGLHRPDGAP